MRVLAWLSLVLGCLVLTGCHALGRRSAATDKPRPTLDVNPPGDRAAAAGREAPGQPTSASSGLLAGQVLDSSNRRPPPTFIQVTAVREAHEPKTAPLEVAADSQGYFTIQGLQPGRHYQLIARARDGDQLLAGTTWATPPNPRVVIRMSQELATPATPPLPPSPGVGAGPPQPATKAAPLHDPPPPAWPPAAPRGDQAWAPRGGAPNRGSPSFPSNPRRPADLGVPIAADEKEAPPAPPGQPQPDRMAGQPSLGRRDAPVLGIGPPPGPPPQGVSREGAPVPSSPAEPPPIPFCSLTGRQLHNFALYDLNGQPWEFRQRRNRLTLIEFWGTWCVYCLHSIPHLNILQEKYRPYGLEVVGIAYEQGPPQHHADQVRRVQQRQKINYTLLLGADRLQCPVRSQFRVVSWPTCFLIDENGRILWQESGLDKAKLAELEKLIRQQLGVR